MHHDLAILGAGLGGSITALVAKQMGLNPILIERGKHPRFAIGESATPQADIALASIAKTPRFISKSSMILVSDLCHSDRIQ